jgi:NADH-quinone oxidoreductase subunit G
MCSRCVRFTREISGQAELQVIHRGTHSEIDIFPGEPLNNKLATNVVDLCPVGALCSKDFLYKQRVWYLQEHDSVCPRCNTGCSVHVDVNKDIVYRLRPRVNPQAQGHFMCDEGRLGYHYVNSADRFTRPLKEQKPAGWPEVVKEVRQALKQAGKVAGVLSPFLTCEEAYLLARYLKGLSSDITLALGPVPLVGADDTYPKDRKGRPVEPVKFTIRAEKCPNRRGVEEILRHFQGGVIGFEEVVHRAGEGQFQAIYVTAGYPPRAVSWILPDQVTALRRATLIVQDLLPSPLSETAKYVVPAASFAEKDGLFVNHASLAQALRRACRPPGEVRSDGQVFLDLMERKGLYHAESIRAELAREVSWFAPLGTGKIAEQGLRLG